MTVREIFFVKQSRKMYL